MSEQMPDAYDRLMGALDGLPDVVHTRPSFVYPAAVTLLVTGGGAGTLYLMAAPLWLVVLGFVIMLACSAFAALAGRFLRSSILSAAFALMFTYAAVLIAFLVAWNPPA